MHEDKDAYEKVRKFVDAGPVSHYELVLDF